MTLGRSAERTNVGRDEQKSSRPRKEVLNSRPKIAARRVVPHAALDLEAVLAAYRRWAGIYDWAFGAVSAAARRRTVALINRLPGHRVLEVGVGTGLALPLYASEKRVSGIDLSPEMLDRARRRAAESRLDTVETLAEMDAEAMSFRDASFDIAVAMFVASVVPHPRRLAAEMRRVVVPGGQLLFINHFAAEAGPRWWVEWALAPGSRALGWHPDFAIEALLSAGDRANARVTPAPPGGLFTLVELANV